MKTIGSSQIDGSKIPEEKVRIKSNLKQQDVTDINM